MATDDTSRDAVRNRLREEREQLAQAVEVLRAEVHEATNVAARLTRPPVLAAGALGAGFVLAGGLRATFRLLFRR